MLKQTKIEERFRTPIYLCEAKMSQNMGSLRQLEDRFLGEQYGTRVMVSFPSMAMLLGLEKKFASESGNLHENGS